MDQTGGLHSGRSTRLGPSLIREQNERRLSITK
jgi:hypothetical protein